jgi:hypothetical protein
MKTVVCALIVTLGTAAPLPAQWLKEPTRGIPRTKDGKPDLTAPAPKTADGKPDLSGLWRIDAGAYGGNIVVDLKPGEIQPWADELYKQRMENLGKDDPGTFKCLPHGPRVTLGFGGWARIIQTPGVIAILYENLSHRQIFMDGRELPTDPHPSFMGYSVGRWEKDTLVVESIGFKDTTWLDFGGHPHTEQLRVVERIRRPSLGHLDVQVTYSDPTIYSRPWTVPVKVDLVVDTEMLEYVCNENEKDYAHLVGKASDDKKNAVDVPRDILSKYVGAYEFRSTEDPNLVTLANVTLKGAELFVDIGGKDPQPMIPLSNTLFAAVGGRMEFVAGEKGVVTHLIFRAVEGDIKAPRK